MVATPRGMAFERFYRAQRHEATKGKLTSSPTLFASSRESPSHPSGAGGVNCNKAGVSSRKERCVAFRGLSFRWDDGGCWHKILDTNNHIGYTRHSHQPQAQSAGGTGHASGGMVRSCCRPGAAGATMCFLGQGSICAPSGWDAAMWGFSSTCTGLRPDLYLRRGSIPGDRVPVAHPPTVVRSGARVGTGRNAANHPGTTTGRLFVGLPPA